MTKDELIKFEAEIADLFNAGKIKAPVHLAGGNEDQLIEIFKEIEPDDWVFGTWRSHYHCLLKGVPPDELKAAILRGRSIGLCFPQQRVLCSALVGGNAPLALGVAWSIKRSGGENTVWCFMGDMGSRTGIVRECQEYAKGHELPIVFVIESNGMSVGTKTSEVWGTSYGQWDDEKWYHYELKWPHVGAGRWIPF